MSNFPGFDAAQREYDNRTPPEDGPSECDNCNGFGHAPAPGDPDGDHAKCSVCEGFGLLLDGEPFDPHAAEYAAADRADAQRDDRLTHDNGDQPIYDDF